MGGAGVGLQTAGWGAIPATDAPAGRQQRLRGAVLLHAVHRTERLRLHPGDHPGPQRHVPPDRTPVQSSPLPVDRCPQKTVVPENRPGTHPGTLSGHQHRPTCRDRKVVGVPGTGLPVKWHFLGGGAVNLWYD